jgi:50S ribosomal protein L16 3-hydroxylase
MLASWVAPAGIDQFRRDILRRSACARAHSADHEIDLLTWDVLGEVLAATEPAPDVIVCAKGHMLPFPAPRDLAELRAYMRLGIGIAMRHTERCHPHLRAVADDFESVLGGTAQVQVFVTPGGTHGFGWHYDAEDVFIVQTAGIKDYYFRENTVEPEAPFPPPDFNGYLTEKSPLQTACLVPGDFLYIPARWWHMALCREESLSISVGVSEASSSDAAGAPIAHH